MGRKKSLSKCWGPIGVRRAEGPEEKEKHMDKVDGGPSHSSVDHTLHGIQSNSSGCICQ